MDAIVEIDKAGRIVIPKKMRDALRLKPGTRLRVDCEGSRLLLEHDVPEPHLEMREGVWVMAGGPPGDVDAVGLVERERERRMQFVSGQIDEP